MIRMGEIDFKSIDVQEARKMIGHGNVTVIDIRDAASYNEAHIENAILVNDDNIEKFLKEADKNKPLICYCYYGNNSQGAARFFRQEGFKEVYNIQGGFEKYREIL